MRARESTLANKGTAEAAVTPPAAVAAAVQPVLAAATVKAAAALAGVPRVPARQLLLQQCCTLRGGWSTAVASCQLEGLLPTSTC